MEPGAFGGEITFEAFGHAAEMSQQRFVAGGCFQHRLFNATQNRDRVVPGGLPQVSFETTKEVNGRVVPTPTEIVGDGQKRFERLRQGRTNFKGSDGFHGVLRLKDREKGSDREEGGGIPTISQWRGRCKAAASDGE
jgi:hypothetical protein